MKNFFTKAAVAAGVIASAMALSSIAVFAATTSYTVPAGTEKGTLAANSELVNDANITVQTTSEAKYKKDSAWRSSAYLPQFRNNTTDCTDILVTTKTAGTLTVNIGINSGKTMYIDQGSSVASTHFATASSGSTKGIHPISAKLAANTTYIVYISGTTGVLDSLTFIPESDVVYATGISLDIDSIEIVGTGSQTLTATVEPDNTTDKTVTWTSSDESVATVDGGVVTGVSAGTATITASVKSGANTYETATATVTVSNVAVTGVAFENDTASVDTGDTVQLTATVTPTSATNKTVTWESSDEAVATVEDGVVTGVSAGTATITVKTNDGNFTDECVVTVSDVTGPNYFDLDFRTATAATSKGTYYFKRSGTYIRKDKPSNYAVEITEANFHNNVYGFKGSTSTVITIDNVQGPAKITIGTGDYASAFTFTATPTEGNANGKFAVPVGTNYAENNVLYTIGAKGGQKSIYYTGTDNVKITITCAGLSANNGSIGASNTVYIPTLKVEAAEAPTTLAKTSPFTFDSFYVNDDKTNVYVIGKIARADAASVDTVGFINLFGNNKTVTSTSVAESIVDGETTVKEADGSNYFIALKITGTKSSNKNVFAVLPESVSGTTTTTGAAGTYQLS